MLRLPLLAQLERCLPSPARLERCYRPRPDQARPVLTERLAL